MELIQIQGQLIKKAFITYVCLSGGQLGIALQLMASGFLATSWGWQAIFYANGTLGALWVVTYMIFGADSPETSRFISKEEVLYIQTSLGRVGEQKVRKWNIILFFKMNYLGAC